MEHNLKCEIVCDLLPSYIDGLTSEVTNEEVQKHVKGCEECKKKLERMQEPEQGMTASLSIDPIQIKEIDYLKKARKKTTQMIATSIFSAIFLVVAVLFVRFFVVGSTLYPEAIAYTVDVMGNELYIKGMITDSGRGVSKISYQEDDGVVTVSFKGALASPFCMGDFNSVYKSENVITQVRIGEQIVWDRGVAISAKTSALYNAKNPYIGNMPANSKIAMLLGIENVLGSFTNELQTSEEPYGWKLILEETINKEQQPRFETQMTSYAMVMLALIDNLGYVTFDYMTLDGQESLTINIEDAESLIEKDYEGQSIKNFADSPVELQRLVQKLGL